LACFLLFVLSGCSLSTLGPPSAEAGLPIQGRVRGGQQPIAGAHVYLFAANTTGYGGSGIAPSAANASVSLLNDAMTGQSDSVGAYVLTDAKGVFSITGDYSCTPNTQVYLYAQGGDPGAGLNAAVGLLAVLGNCPSGGDFATATPFIVINEVSTVTAAYTMAGFATDATHVSSSGTALAEVGIQNAFANAANLETLSTGVAQATTPAGNGTVPQSEINTLANILAACVNSTGAIAGPANPTACYTLFSNTLGGSSGTTPGDTATAAINMAHHPGVNIAALYGLASAAPPFAPGLSAPPNDFTVGLLLTGGGLNNLDSFAFGIAIDGSGNAWVTNTDGANVTELSSSGAVLSEITSGDLDDPQGIAIDGFGNAWVTNFANSSVTELSSSGAVLSGASGYYYPGVLSTPSAITIDGTGNVWVADETLKQVVELSSSGSLLAPPNGYYGGGGINAPFGIAVDGAGNVLTANLDGSSVSKLSNSGSAISPSAGYTGGGVGAPYAIAVDHSGNIWTANGGDRLAELSNSGVAISPPGGYTGGGNFVRPGGIAIDGSGNAWATGNGVAEFSSSGAAISPSTGYLADGMSLPVGIAIDGSGDVWITNSFYEQGGRSSVTEFIGAATPVITPICAGLPATPTTDGSSNLGTRP
jgi:hypothetical protein